MVFSPTRVIPARFGTGQGRHTDQSTQHCTVRPGTGKILDVEFGKKMSHGRSLGKNSLGNQPISDGGKGPTSPTKNYS